MRQVDLVITDAQVLNVFTRKFEPASLWIDGQHIVSRLLDAPLTARQTVSLPGKFIVPGSSTPTCTSKAHW